LLLFAAAAVVAVADSDRTNLTVPSENFFRACNEVRDETRIKYTRKNQNRFYFLKQIKTFLRIYFTYIPSRIFFLSTWSVLPNQVIFSAPFGTFWYLAAPYD